MLPFFFFLWPLSGYFDVGTIDSLVAIEAVDVAMSVIQASFYLDKYSPPNASVLAKRERMKNGLKNIASWAYPVFHASTEQYGGLSAVCRMPFSNTHCLWWIEPSAYGMGESLFLNPYKGKNLYFDIDKKEPKELEEDFYRSPGESSRYSLGGGVRLLLSPQYTAGVYGYYDYTPLEREHQNRKIISSANINFASLKNTFSVGAELFTPIGHVVGNIYRSSVASPFIKVKKLSPCWSGDIKVSLNYKQLTLALGRYYKQLSIIYEPTALPLLDTETHAQEYLGVYGSAFELKYTWGCRTYGVKYTYDNLEKNRASLTMQWQLLKPWSVSHQSNQRLCLRASERYLGASQLHICNTAKLIGSRMDYAKSYVRQWVKEGNQRLEVKNSPELPEMRESWEAFVAMVGGNKSSLNDEERKALQRCLRKVPETFGDWAFNGAMTPPRDIKKASQALRALPFEKDMDLPKLMVAYSSVQHILWLEILRRNHEAPFELSRPVALMGADILTSDFSAVLDSLEAMLTGVSTDEYLPASKFSLSKKQLAIINEFALAAKGYFTRAGSQQLMSMQENFKETWSLGQAKRGADQYIKIQRNAQLIHPLKQLKQAAEEKLEFYKKNTFSFALKSEPDIATLKTIHRKLREAIIANLDWQLIALLLADCPRESRYSLLCFSNLTQWPIDPVRLGLGWRHANPDKGALQLDPVLLHLRRLPAELQKEILKWFISDLLERNATLRQHENNRNLKFKDFFPIVNKKEKDGESYEEHEEYEMESRKHQAYLLDHRADRLLGYLHRIAMEKDQTSRKVPNTESKAYSKIQENKSLAYF